MHILPWWFVVFHNLLSQSNFPQFPSNWKVALLPVPTNIEDKTALCLGLAHLHTTLYPQFTISDMHPFKYPKLHPKNKFNFIHDRSWGTHNIVLVFYIPEGLCEIWYYDGEFLATLIWGEKLFLIVITRTEKYQCNYSWAVFALPQELLCVKEKESSFLQKWIITQRIRLYDLVVQILCTWYEYFTNILLMYSPQTDKTRQLSNQGLIKKKKTNQFILLLPTLHVPWDFVVLVLVCRRNGTSKHIGIWNFT